MNTKKDLISEILEVNLNVPRALRFRPVPPEETVVGTMSEYSQRLWCIIEEKHAVLLEKSDHLMSRAKKNESGTTEMSEGEIRREARELIGLFEQFSSYFHIFFLILRFEFPEITGNFVSIRGYFEVTWKPVEEDTPDNEFYLHSMWVVPDEELLSGKKLGEICDFLEQCE